MTNEIANLRQNISNLSRVNDNLKDGYRAAQNKIVVASAIEALDTAETCLGFGDDQGNADAVSQVRMARGYINQLSSDLNR